MPPIPVIPVAITVATSAASTVGLLAGVTGGVDWRRARIREREHETHLAERYAAHLAEVDRTNAELDSLDHELQRAQSDVRARIGDFLARGGIPTHSNGHPIIEGVTFPTEYSRPSARGDVSVRPWVGGAAAAGAAGTATPRLLRAAAHQWGTASTGTRIAGLYGASHEAALEALFGGGSKAAGGWGRAFGSKALKASVIGPALLIIGATVMTQGTQRIEAADAFGALVNHTIKKLNLRDELLRGVQGWAQEKREVIGQIIGEATDALDILESEPYDDVKHQPRLQEALLLTTSVRLLVESVIAKGASGFGDGTDRLTITYRDEDEAPGV